MNMDDSTEDFLSAMVLSIHTRFRPTGFPEIPVLRSPAALPQCVGAGYRIKSSLGRGSDQCLSRSEAVLGVLIATSSEPAPGLALSTPSKPGSARLGR